MAFRKNELINFTEEEIVDLIEKLDHCKKLITVDFAGALKMYAKLKNDPEVTDISKQMVNKHHEDVINSEGFKIFINLTTPFSKFKEEKAALNLEEKWEQILESIKDEADKKLFKKKTFLVSLSNHEAFIEVDEAYIDLINLKKEVIDEALEKVFGEKKYRVRFSDVEQISPSFLSNHKKINLLDRYLGIGYRFRTPSFPWLSKGREFFTRTKKYNKSHARSLPYILSNRNIEILMGDDSYSIHYGEKSKFKNINEVEFLSYEDSLALENLLRDKNKRNILITFLLSKLSIEFSLKIKSVQDLKNDQDNQINSTQLSKEQQLDIDKYLAEQINKLFKNAKEESIDFMPKKLSYDNELWSKLRIKCEEIRFSLTNLCDENQKNIQLFETDKNIELMEEVYNFLEKEGFDPNGSIPTIAELGEAKGGGGFGLVRKIALEAKGLKQFRNDYSKWLKTKKSLELNLIENEDNLIKLPEDKFTTNSILDQIPLEPCLSSKEIMDCWDKNRNYNIHPLTTSKFSNKAAFFKCEKGHTWSTIIRHYKGCPTCLSAKKFKIKKGNQS